MYEHELSPATDEGWFSVTLGDVEVGASFAAVMFMQSLFLASGDS